MKKRLFRTMAMAFALFLLTGCLNQAENPHEEKIHIIATTFPQYDWVREILGDEAEHVTLTMLLDNGVDLHNYQPTVGDITSIATCDMFIYNGGTSDAWVEKALKTAKNEDVVVVNLLEVLGDFVKDEEMVEGMEHDHEEGHHDEGDFHEEVDAEKDEHVWLSLKNAGFICTYLADELSKQDPEKGDLYKENAAIYNRKLNALDDQYKEVVKGAPIKTLIFGDRFPFRYLVDDYGLQYYAAFSGCSSETEASFETVAFLSKKMDELRLNNIMAIENSDQSIARTIVQNTKNKNQEILVMDSMQFITTSDRASENAYLSIMEKNLEVLRKALKGGV